MHTDPNRIEVTRSLYFLINSTGHLDVDSELVLAQAGRYIRMGLGEDVRVREQGRPRTGCTSCEPITASKATSNSLSALKIRMPAAKALSHLFGYLTHAQHDSANRLLIHLEDAEKLASRDDIESRTLPRKQLENRQIGVRLHCIANEVISMAKGMGEEAITIQDLACGIDIQRGPILLRQPNQGNIFTVQYRFVLGIAGRDDRGMRSDNSKASGLAQIRVAHSSMFQKRKCFELEPIGVARIFQARRGRALGHVKWWY